MQAAEAVPGDRSVVHHIIVYVFDSKRPGNGRDKLTHFCGYAPAMPRRSSPREPPSESRPEPI